MELLIITAVESYETDIKRLLLENGVKVYSQIDVTGHKDLNESARDDNWFASGISEHKSTLYYAFVEAGLVDGVLDSVANFNKKQDVKSHVHAVVMDVKKSI